MGKEKKIISKIDYYRCKICGHRISKEQLEVVRYNYPCGGTILVFGWDGKVHSERCGESLSDYEPIFKEGK